MSLTEKLSSSANLLFVACFLLVSDPPFHGQEIRDIGHFWAMNGTVQLLPTGNVLKREEGKVTLYSYNGVKYAANRESNVLEQISNWTYFDWEGVDWDDQIDRNDSDVPNNLVRPDGAKVKKILYLSARNAGTITAVVCYTMPEPKEEHPLLPTASQIWVVTVRGTKTTSGYSYQKLWEKKLEEQSNYGELDVQQISSIGRVLVLYSASAGGSSESEQLDIYQLK